MTEGITNESLILSLFNQYIFQSAKNEIEHIEYYFSTNPSTIGNPFIEELIKAIKTYSLDAIGEPLFNSILMKCRKTPQEASHIMQELIKWKNYSKEEIQPAAKYLKDIVSASIISRANKLYAESPSDYLKYLKNANISTSDIETFTATSFDSIDINTIIAESGNSVINTNVDFINRVFPSAGGIERGQLGIISAPPGVGKTLAAMNLALCMASQGEKVLYVSCADMNMKDFIVRMGSIAFGISFTESFKNLPMVYERLKSIVKDNLEISINAGGTVSGDDIIEKATAGNYTVVFIDYDGVLEGVSDGDSMYNTFGDLYNKLTKLSIAGKLVFVCSQPKVFAYDKLIGLADIGESSRKQQVADFIWTISNVNQDCPNHLYVMSFPKARRGRVGSKCYVIRIEGRFIEIPKGVYDQLRVVTEEKDYTEADINQMVAMYNQQYNDIQKNLQQVQQPNNRPEQRHLQNPFTN